MTDQDLKTILCSKCDTLNSDHARWCRSCGAAFPDNPVRILPPGTMLDHEQYTITAFMGRGDASLTYRARKKNSAGEVVVKEYYPEGIAMRDQDGYRVRPASPDTELGYDQGLRQFMHAGNILHPSGSFPTSPRSGMFSRQTAQPILPRTISTVFLFPPFFSRRRYFPSTRPWTACVP